MKTRMKNLLCLFLVLFGLSFLLSGVWADAAGETVGEEGFWSFQKDTGVLTVYGSGELPGYCVSVGYPPPWDEWDLSVKEIIISEGITNVGSEAFGGCANVTRVTLPSTLETIPYGAFWYCDSLKTVTIPENVKKIDEMAFAFCEGLEEFRVDEDNGYYASCDGVLYNKAMTELLQCPSGFRGSVAIAEGTVKIAEAAFSFCDYLTEVRLPGSIKEIGYYAFNSCSRLERADLSALTCAFDAEIFRGCSSLKQIILPKENSCYKQDAQGALYTPNMTCLVLCPGGYSGTFVVPDGVTKIGTYAFADNESLKRVQIPRSVKYIESGAFEDCTALETVTFSNGLKIIEERAFEGCTSLKTVGIPYTVETIGCRAFNYCTGLKKISLPEGLETLEELAFGNCVALTSVSIPNSVSYVGDGAFSYCEELTSVILPGNVDIISSDVFYGSYEIRDVYFRGPAPSLEGWDHVLWMIDCWECTLYYVEGQEGWTTPSWNGYLTKKWSGTVAADVIETEYFYTPVQWAMETGVTTGVGRDLFRPDDTCTRGQIVTFLWRAAGCPEPESSYASFTDVAMGAYYYKAVLWAVEQGITTGVGRNRFNPDGTCTRGQVATFLWRAQGQPAPTAQESRFTDVSSDTYYAQAVLWAVEQGITNGVGKDRFNPDGSCTRGQIVTFLWRWAGEPKLGTNLSPYAPVVREIMELYDTGDHRHEGLLCDMDGDGVEELIIMYHHNAWAMCDVYTIRDGAAIPLMKNEKIQLMVGGNVAYSGLLEEKDKLYFYTMGRSYEDQTREGYVYAYEEIYTWKLYSFANGEWTMEKEIKLDLVSGYLDGCWTLIPDTYALVDGELISFEDYAQWYDELKISREMDGAYIEDEDGFTYSLEQLLQMWQ